MSVELAIAHLARALDAGDVTSVELVTESLARIEARDGRLNSLIEVDPNALERAQESDVERSKGETRGPLHGIPIALKDNIDTLDATNTTAGSLALAGSRPGSEATVAARLRRAGAVVLAKANLSEWANFRSTSSVSGWSARGGQTRNPYDPTRSPVGSSSGSAAAVSAALVTASVGTETDGSIVAPASVCGIVGFKPTVGLSSRTGIVPISSSQDTAGPMVRCVADAAFLLDVMAGPDPSDRATARARRPADGYVDRTVRVRLAGARIGVARSLSDFSHETDDTFDASLEALRRGGAHLIDPIDLAWPDSNTEHELQILLHEFKVGINGYLATRTLGSPRTLADLIAYNESDERETRWFGQDLFERAEGTTGLDSDDYRRAVATVQPAARSGIDLALATHGLDVIVAKSLGPAWVIDPETGDPTDIEGSSSMSAVAGYPIVSVPIGLVHGLPVGMSVLGSAWSEPALLRVAAGLEWELGRIPPPDL